MKDFNELLVVPIHVTGFNPSIRKREIIGGGRSYGRHYYYHYCYYYYMPSSWAVTIIYCSYHLYSPQRRHYHRISLQQPKDTCHLTSLPSLLPIIIS